MKQLNTLTVRFLIVGGIGFVVNYSVLSLLTGFLGLHKVTAEICAAVVALQVTFLLHDNWTYKPKTTELTNKMRVALLSRYLLFITSNAFSSVMTVLLFAAFSHFIALKVVALGLAALAAMAWNYVVNKFVIWKHQNSGQESTKE